MTIESKDELCFSRIIFEITRKCNMNCMHCAKGCQQNITITKEIIDKTLDTVKNNRIYAIELFGGEPTLEPNIIEYVINGIIERKMIIAGFAMTTNGMIANEQISHAFNKMGNYLSEQEGIASEYRSFVEKEYKNLSETEKYYDDYFNEKAHCSIQVSTYTHDNADKARNSYEFYKENANRNVSVKWQTEYKEYTNMKDGKEFLYLYMGNAADNYERLCKEWNFRIKDNNGALREPGHTLVNVPIYICANGNVVNSSLLSYNVEDDSNKFICNILTDNIFEKMEEWNFKHPLNHSQRKARQWCATEIFNWEHGIRQIYKSYPEYQLTEDVIKQARNNLELFEFIEEVKTNLHIKFPYLTFDELQFAADTLLEIKTKGNYLTNSYFSGYEPSQNYIYNEKELYEGLNAYKYLNDSRKPKGVNHK